MSYDPNAPAEATPPVAPDEPLPAAPPAPDEAPAPEPEPGEAPPVVEPPAPEPPKSLLQTLIDTVGLDRDELIDRLLVGAYGEGSFPSRDELLGIDANHVPDAPAVVPAATAPAAPANTPVQTW